MFDNPTVSAIATWLQEAPRIAGSALIPRAPRDAALPLSFAQQRMWFLTQFEEQSAAYTVPSAVRIQGPLRIDALAESIRRVAERHEILRTVYPDTDGGPVQAAIPAPEVPLPVIDLEPLGESEKEARVHELAREEAGRPFDLARDIPLRVALLRLAPEEHVLIATIHHIASDGW